jgi:hypothetical protein
VAPNIQAKESGMFKFESDYKTVAALLDADTKTPLEAGKFDDELWLLLTKKVHNPSDLKKYPETVGVYFASRYVQWEVGNGGFAQAAENVPEWFALAASGYESLGKPKFAALIRKAMTLLQSGSEDTLEAQLEALDAEIPAGEWEIDNERVEFVRKHRSDFAGIR